jgi:hypothetical protein
MMSVSTYAVGVSIKGDVYLAVYPDQRVCRAFERHLVIASNAEKSSASN